MISGRDAISKSSEKVITEGVTADDTFISLVGLVSVCRRQHITVIRKQLYKFIEHLLSVQNPISYCSV